MAGERIRPGIWTVLYVAAIPATNWLFDYVGVQPIPGTDQVWHPLAILVGLWLVLRDFAHQELGDRWIMAPIVAGVALSYALSSPRIATASAIAFLASELVDYTIYRWTRRPLSTRILLSSAASVPVDSVLFYSIAFGWAAVNPLSLGVMLAEKMAGAMVVAAMLRGRSA
jgi:uncharacterized PurR-regulated membrane protein YhhQ (DUF165 family)